MTAREASEAIEKVRELDEEQAQHAAERQAQGQGGICEDCGAVIPPERLEVLPDATRCVSCQAKHSPRR